MEKHCIDRKWIFEELGLSEKFEYLGSGGHHVIRVLCKTCQNEITRTDDVTRNRALSIRCPICKTRAEVIRNTRKDLSEEKKIRKETERKERIDKFVKLYFGGMSLRQISEYTGYGKPHIRNVLKEQGIEFSIRTSEAENKERLTEKYRQKFAELGIEGFEFIRYENTNKIWFRCKKCGDESPRGNDLFKGKQSKLICRKCGNGMFYHSKLANDIISFYAEGHSNAETCTKFGIGKEQLKSLVKFHGVHSGRSQSDISRNGGKVQAQKMIAESENKLAISLLETGFAYLGGYENGDSFIRISCLTCGNVFERQANWIKKNGATCPKCKAAEQTKLRTIRETEKAKEREEKKKRKEALRAIINPLGLSPYQLEREKRLDETDVCKVCGKTFVLRDYVNEAGLKFAHNPHYCSVACKDASIRAREKEYKKRTGGDGNSRRRCKKFDCYYSGHKITWQTKAKREGLSHDEIYCAICGRKCDPNDNSWGGHTGPTHPSIDHIISLKMGGSDTWENTQFACMECNSKWGAKLKPAKGGDAV